MKRKIFGQDDALRQECNEGAWLHMCDRFGDPIYIDEDRQMPFRIKFAGFASDAYRRLSDEHAVKMTKYLEGGGKLSDDIPGARARRLEIAVVCALDWENCPNPDNEDELLAFTKANVLKVLSADYQTFVQNQAIPHIENARKFRREASKPIEVVGRRLPPKEEQPDPNLSTTAEIAPLMAAMGKESGVGGSGVSS